MPLLKEKMQRRKGKNKLNVFKYLLKLVYEETCDEVNTVPLNPHEINRKLNKKLGFSVFEDALRCLFYCTPQIALHTAHIGRC